MNQSAVIQQPARAVIAGALASLWDRFVASDPGLTRLASASRVTASVVLVVAVLGWLAHLLDVPVTVALLGAIVAMQTALAVNDAAPRTTTMLIPIPATLGIVLGALVQSRGFLSDIVFLVVLFGAVAVRRFGQRWTVFGTIATLTYFVALFFDATVAQLPALIAGIALAVALTYLVRFVVLRDPPGWTARRIVEAYRARLRLLVAAAREVLEKPAGDAHALREVTSAAQRLNETARAIEGRLTDEAGDMARAVFDAELAAEDIGTLALRLRAVEADPPRALRVALGALEHGRTAPARRLALRIRDDIAQRPRARELAAAIVDLGDAVHAARGLTAAASKSTGAAPRLPPPQQPPLLQAVQVTVAAAAAIVVGEALSPQRWYWAVLATYFVFIGTASAGETLQKAWSRTIGTALGVALGVLVGHFAIGHTALAVTMIVACLFLGVYFLRVSYAVMIFFITALLSLLWALLGRFSDGLLGVRLAETAIGAIFGALAATMLFPTRTRDVVREAVRDVFDATGTVVDESIARLIDPHVESLAVLAASRTLDERLQHFLDRAHPVIATLAPSRASAELRPWISTLSACAYHARSLAGLVQRAAHPVPPEVVPVLQRLEDAVRENIRAAAARFEGAHSLPTIDTASLVEELLALDRNSGADTVLLDAATRLVDKIDRAIRTRTSPAPT